MDIFSLRCFVMLAKHLNYTKTAMIMNVSQPSLTRIIQNLEDELGILLIDRSKYRIELTNSGTEFLKHIIPTINSYDEAVFFAKGIERYEKGLVKIGFLSYMCAPLMPAVYRRIKDEFPDLELDLVPYRMDDLITSLNSRQIDIGLMPDWKFSNYLIDCNKKPFFKDKIYIVLHRDHPMAERQSISLSELENETYLFYRGRGDYHTDTEHESIFFMNRSVDMAVLPNIRHLTDFVGLFALLDCNLGFSILPSHTKNYCPDSLRFVEISPPMGEFVGIMCWSEENENPYLKSIQRIIEEVGNDYVSEV